MFCNKCGTQFTEGAKFCRVCGEPLTGATSQQAASEAPTSEIPAATAQAAQQVSASTAEPPTDGKALGSLISGILGLTVFFVIGSIVAIVLGHLSLNEIKKSAGRLKGRGMAIAGLVMGYMGIAFIPVILIIAAIAIPNLLRARIGANESQAIRSVRTIHTAQTVYSASNPEKGFTCSLESLGSDGIDRALASGSKSGYSFTLRDCESEISDGPVVRYKLTATPIHFGSTGGKTFCTDESGDIKYVKADSTDACLTEGMPIDD